MAVYRFENWGTLDIIDPELEIVFSDENPKITGVHIQDIQYDIDIVLVSDGVRFGLNLKKVQAESLDWQEEGANMRNQIWSKLEENLVIE